MTAKCQVVIRPGPVRSGRTAGHSPAGGVPIKINLGDADLVVELKIRGQPPLPRMMLRVGVPRPTTEADRVVRSPRPFRHRKVDITVDLAADQQVPLSVQWTDELGNPVEAPGGASFSYVVDDTTIINLTDNGDGTAMAAATGTLGTANVTVTATVNGVPMEGTLNIIVVAGLAERITIVAGTPEEITPDTP